MQLAGYLQKEDNYEYPNENHDRFKSIDITTEEHSDYMKNIKKKKSKRNTIMTSGVPHSENYSDDMKAAIKQQFREQPNNSKQESLLKTK